MLSRFLHSQQVLLLRRQRGAALLLMMVIGVVAAAAWLVNSDLVSAQAGARLTNERDVADLAALADAKEVLFAHLLRTRAGRNAGAAPTLGYLPEPDLATDQTGVGGDNPTRNYDGTHNSGCAVAGWVAGGTPQFNSGSPSGINQLRCLGRLPWRDLGLTPWNGSAQNDPDGRAPWYAVSANMLVPDCPSPFNANMLTAAYANWPANCDLGFSNGSKRVAWLTVVDERGNVLTNRAAYVLIMPGPSLGSQARPAPPTGVLPGPPAYLDSVTVQPGCTMPCVPGVYNNAQLNRPNNLGFVFIDCARPRTVQATDPNFAQPYQCNDRVVYATIDELIARAQKGGFL